MSGVECHAVNNINFVSFTSPALKLVGLVSERALEGTGNSWLFLLSATFAWRVHHVSCPPFPQPLRLVVRWRG